MNILGKNWGLDKSGTDGMFTSMENVPSVPGFPSLDFLDFLDFPLPPERLPPFQYLISAVTGIE